MRRKLRMLIGAVVALAVMAALGVVFLRQALLRGPVRQAAEARLSAALGQPVTIGSVGVSLFPAPAITGTDIHVGSATVQAPSVQLARIRIVPTLRSLFSQTITIEDVRLEGFVVSVLHGRDGRWHAPAAVPAPGTSQGAGVSIARVRIVDGQLRVFDETAEGMRERSAIDRIDADLVPDDSGIRLAPIRGRIGNAEITGEARADRTGVRLEFTAPAIGNDDLTPMLALLDSTRPPLLRLDKPATVTADVHIDRASSRLGGGGTIRAPAVTLDPLHATDVAAPFTIEGPS